MVGEIVNRCINRLIALSEKRFHDVYGDVPHLHAEFRPEGGESRNGEGVTDGGPPTKRTGDVHHGSVTTA